MIAGDAPATCYAVHRLFDAFPTSRWILPDWSAPAPTHPKRDRKAKRSLFVRLRRVLRSKVLSQTIRRRNDRIRQLLGDLGTVHRRSPDLVLNAHEFNTPRVWKLIAAWKVDLIVTAGVPILRDPWLTMATHGCLNLHFGIAPDYRGEHTLFYPLIERRWDMLGFTIHFIDQGVDTGPILLRAYPALDGTEDEAAVWAKCSQLAARLLPEIVDDVFHGRANSIQQKSNGRLIRYLDRSIWDELRLWYGHFAPSPRPEGIKRPEQ